MLERDVMPSRRDDDGFGHGRGIDESPVHGYIRPGMRHDANISTLGSGQSFFGDRRNLRIAQKNLEYHRAADDEQR